MHDDHDRQTTVKRSRACWPVGDHRYHSKLLSSMSNGNFYFWLSVCLQIPFMRFLSTAFFQRCCFSATMGNYTANGLTVLEEDMGKGKKGGVSIRVAQSLGVKAILFKNRNKVSKSTMT